MIDAVEYLTKNLGSTDLLSNNSDTQKGKKAHGSSSMVMSYIKTNNRSIGIQKHLPYECRVLHQRNSIAEV